MKNTMVSIAIAAIIVIVACQKNDMMNNTFGIDTKTMKTNLASTTQMHCLIIML